MCVYSPLGAQCESVLLSMIDGTEIGKDRCAILCKFFLDARSGVCVCVCVLFRQWLSVPVLIAHSLLFFFFFPRKPFGLSGHFYRAGISPTSASKQLEFNLSVHYTIVLGISPCCITQSISNTSTRSCTMFQCCFVSFVTCRGFTETCVYSWRLYLIEMWLPNCSCTVTPQHVELCPFVD